MCTQKSRPIDAFQRIMTSFKHFENKLDKLQEDVNYHGQTLSELRAMVTSLSGGTITAADSKCDEYRRLHNKTIQGEDKTCLVDSKIKKKVSTQPLPPKLKAKSFQRQKSKISPQVSPFQVQSNKSQLSSKGISQKHAQRHRKADAQRKTNALRTQKLIEKKQARQA